MGGVFRGVKLRDWALAGGLTALGVLLMSLDVRMTDAQVRAAIAEGSMVHTQSSHSLWMIPVFVGTTLPLLWWRFRHTDREALVGIALVMVVVVLFVPAALPWYYTWPLAVAAALTQSRQAIAVIAGLSTWITVIWKPDGAHGMYSWIHVLLATACAAVAWYSLNKVAVNKPSPGPDAPLPGPDASAAHPPVGH